MPDLQNFHSKDAHGHTYKTKVIYASVHTWPFLTVVILFRYDTEEDATLYFLLRLLFIWANISFYIWFPNSLKQKQILGFAIVLENFKSKRDEKQGSMISGLFSHF